MPSGKVVFAVPSAPIQSIVDSEMVFAAALYWNPSLPPGVLLPSNSNWTGVALPFAFGLKSIAGDVIHPT